MTQPSESVTSPADTSVPESAPTLAELMETARSIFVELLERSIGTPDVAGACFYSALLVQSLVEKFLGFKARVRGGDGVLDGGYVEVNGNVQGHYWVEAEDPKTGEIWVLDCTADQFGDAPVIILKLPDARSKYRPGDQATVDGHVERERRDMAAAVSAAS